MDVNSGYAICHRFLLAGAESVLEISLSRVSGYRRSRRGRDDAPFIRFYEKVIKVKADVAALLIFFLTSTMLHPVAWRAVKGAVFWRSS
jgi:hypothetical protein